MKRIALPGLALLLLTALLAVPGAAAEGDYAQSYVILINGEPAGSEVVRESAGADGTLTSVSEHEIVITDGIEANRMAYTARMVFSAAREPVSYRFQYTSGASGDSFEVSVAGGQITRVLTRSGQTSEVSIPAPPDMVIFDFNVYHQADAIAARYDAKKGGRQTFANFIPVVGADLPLEVTATGTGRMKTPAGDMEVRTFRLDLAGIWTGNLTVDGGNRLVRLVIPARNLEVVRADLMPGVPARPSVP